MKDEILVLYRNIHNISILRNTSWHIAGNMLHSRVPARLKNNWGVIYETNSQLHPRPVYGYKSR